MTGQPVRLKFNRGDAKRQTLTGDTFHHLH
jgi:hypothetical protein